MKLETLQTFHVSRFTFHAFMIFLGSDHAGFALKEAIKNYLRKLAIKFEDLGALKLDKNDDYPDYGRLVAGRVAAAPKNNRGILVCGSAEGMAIVANKFRGVRAAVVYDEKTARESREHNNANIISLSGWEISESKAKKFLKIWLGAKFAGGRHARRLKKILEIEKKNFKL